jgi:hypothetical protein
VQFSGVLGRPELRRPEKDRNPVKPLANALADDAAASGPTYMYSTNVTGCTAHTDLDFTAVPSQFYEGTTVNAQITAKASNGDTAEFTKTLRRPTGPMMPWLEVANPDYVGIPKVTFDLGSAPKVTDASLVSTQSVDSVTEAMNVETGVSAAAYFRATSAAGQTGPWICGGYKGQSTYVTTPEEFVRVLTSSNGTASVTEDIGSEHTLGVAVQVDKGPWTASGSIERTTTISGGSALPVNSSYGVYLENQVRYRKFYEKCVADAVIDGFPAYVYMYKYKYEPVSWVALMDSDLTHNVSGRYRPTYTTCQGGATNQEFYKYKGSGVTFAGALSVSGVSLSARASFSSNMSIRWHVNSTPAHMCGSTANGWLTSPEAELNN